MFNLLWGFDKVNVEIFDVFRDKDYIENVNYGLKEFRRGRKCSSLY